MFVSARERFAEAYQQTEAWLFRSALPLWADVGIDPAGGFFEKIDQKGDAIEAPRRTRVIARQIYCFAAAERMGWQGNGLNHVTHGLEAFYRTLRQSDGLVIATSLADGTLVDRRYDFYDHAFALFALAQAATIPFHRDQALTTAHALQSAVELHFRHPVIGFREAVDANGVLRANPHMHLLEACLALDGVEPQGRWRALANELVSLALERLIDPQTGALRELFNDDWNALADVEGQAVEPGHQFEWAWLLSAWAGTCDAPNAQLAARRLSEIGLQHGLSSSGLVIDELNTDLSPRSTTARSWPQCERLKCHVEWALTDHAQSDRWWDEATRALVSWEPFLRTPVPGLWFDRLTADGKAVDQPAPASTLYHLVCALETARAALSGYTAAATLGLSTHIPVMARTSNAPF